MDILKEIKESCERFPGNDAFVIRDIRYTYHQLAEKITAIRALIRGFSAPMGSLVGVIANDDLETYASVLAVWFEGMVFVPISPRNPKDRNKLVLEQTVLKHILSSSPDTSAIIDTEGLLPAITAGLPESTVDLVLPPMLPEDLMYILFTSGSTGMPKGVCISRLNFNSFIEDFIGIGYSFSDSDRFLQIYDLTFDASLHCYVLPLCFGASVYTVPQDEVKYLYALKLLKDQDITFAKMPPSTLAYLRPYFKNIKLGSLRYSLFGGEPLYVDIALEWLQCIPNARMQNVYGPTELTVNCTFYNCSPGQGPCKSYAGVVSIGKPFGDSKIVVLDEQNNLAPTGTRGELCVSGNQRATGYFKNPEQNERSFIHLLEEGVDNIYYRTGDVVMQDPEGDLLYVGRIDNQAQIQGFRVEMGEIEHHARNFPGIRQAIAIALPNEVGNMQVCLFLENFNGSECELQEWLQQKLPNYMRPSRILNIKEFPKTAGGKIDKKALVSFTDLNPLI